MKLKLLHGRRPPPPPPATTKFFLPMDSISSSLCSSSPSNSHHPFTLPDPSPSHSYPFFPLKFNNPYDLGFDFGCDPAFLPTNHTSNLMNFTGLCSQTHIPIPDLSSSSEFPVTNDIVAPAFNPDFNNFHGSPPPPINPLFAARSKVLRSLEISPPVGAQPTQFQKRAALRQSSLKLGELGGTNWGERAESNSGGGEMDKKRKRSAIAGEEDEFDETATMDVSGVNYDSDEMEPNGEHANGNGNGSNSILD